MRASNASVKVPEAGWETPTTVVDNALRAFESGQTYVVSGVSNYLTASVLPRFLTRGAVLRLAARMWRRTLGR